MQTSSTAILSVRVNSEERALLEAAAEQSQTSLSDFVRRRALESAEMEVWGRSVVTIPAKEWKSFEAWLDRPAKSIPDLAKLARTPPSWQR